MQLADATDPLAIPPFLIISAAKRAESWEKNPPRPMPKFSERVISSADLVTDEFRAQLDRDYIEERDALSAFKRPDTKKAKARREAATLAAAATAAAKAEAVDHTDMRWGRMRGGKYGWVPEFAACMGRGSGASPSATVGRDSVKKPAATGRGAGEREASPQERGSSPRRSTTLKEENHATVMALLTQPEGATLDEIAAATGWLRHSASAYLSGIRKATKNPVPLTKETGKYRFIKEEAP